jgi:hypothetical protein
MLLRIVPEVPASYTEVVRLCKRYMVPEILRNTGMNQYTKLGTWT